MVDAIEYLAAEGRGVGDDAGRMGFNARLRSQKLPDPKEDHSRDNDGNDPQCERVALFAGVECFCHDS